VELVVGNTTIVSRGNVVDGRQIGPLDKPSHVDGTRIGHVKWLGQDHKSYPVFDCDEEFAVVGEMRAACHTLSHEETAFLRRNAVSTHP